MDNRFLLNVTSKLQEQKWRTDNYIQPLPSLSFNDNFTNRYHKLPEDFRFFLSHIQSAMSYDEQSWFLCVNDYNDNSSDSFKWNQYEEISLSAAREDNDAAWMVRIKSFWDCYLPILLSVRSGYSYIAIGVCDNNFGQIFHGIEPEFEEVTLLANSFPEFLEHFIQSNGYPYGDFI